LAAYELAQTIHQGLSDAGFVLAPYDSNQLIITVLSQSVLRETVEACFLTVLSDAKIVLTSHIGIRGDFDLAHPESLDRLQDTILLCCRYHSNDYDTWAANWLAERDKRCRAHSKTPTKF